MQSSKLLINEPPLQVLPTIAKHLDINKAIILQQVQYWISTSGHEIDGLKWIYNSYSEWAKQFPWLTARAVRWHIKGLEQDGYLIAGEYNKDTRDNTKWYRLNYDKIDSLPKPSSGVATNDTPPDNKRHLQVSINDKPLPENTTEITPKNTTEKPSSTKKDRALNYDYRNIFETMQTFLGYPDKTDKDPIPNHGKEAKAIARMMKRGYSEKEILSCWKNKVAHRGEFVSMVYVNEDIGKPERRPRQATLLPTEEDLIATAKQKGLN